RLTGSVGFEHRFRWFNDTDDNPTASERDGHLDQLRFDARWAATPRDIIAGSLYGVYNNADAGFRSYGEHGGRLAYTRLFEPLFGAEARPLALTGAVGYRATDYDDPDPLVAPGTTRRDREWRVSGVASVGLAADWDLVVEVEYREVDSNIELYEFDNFAVTVGGVWHF